MPEPSVFIVDDDAAIRDSISMLLETVGTPCQTFESGDALLAMFDPNWKGCLLLDIRMPGINGMELQQELIDRGSCLPIIFITGHGDVPMAVDAMHKGAFDFIQKPFGDQELLDRIEQALVTAENTRSQRAHLEGVQTLHASLTPREKQVMELIVKGLANKVIAFDLELSQRTVEVHRARIMDKMGVRSLAELVRQAVTLQSK
jgi:two-component system response regulator FixJ